MAVFTEAGPGRKQCQNCRQFCGVRSNSCPGCSHAFERKEPLHKVQARSSGQTRQYEPGPSREDIERRKDTRIVLSTPGGRPPAELTATDEATVRRWARDCIMAQPQFIFTAEALAYWARTFHNIHSEEWREVRDHLNHIPGLGQGRPERNDDEDGDDGEE
jgi:hypothetical protein